MIKIALISAALIFTAPAEAIADPAEAIADPADARPLQDRVCDELARSPSALDECLSMAFPTPIAQCVESAEARSDMESAIVECFFRK